jgi:uncharacterized protein YehS (DUF1456 family)
MTNNDILRRLRYAFDLSDDQMIKLFDFADYTASRATISNWLKKDSDEDFVVLNDEQLAIFLNGFIISQRGKKDGKVPVPEKRLNNNVILRKLKIALSYTDEDIVATLAKMDLKMSKHEVNAFFRNYKQEQYRQCQDQVLRKFIYGLQKIYREEA